jgi:thiol-disulfide isomerase/thioredoxin
MDRLRNLTCGLVFLGLLGCPEEKTEGGPAPSRFAAVKKANDPAAAKAAASFCEKTFPSGASRWTSPPERPVPNGGVHRASSGGWLWVNLWATWCGPCLRELPLLEQWRATLAKDGVPVRFEMWSVDEDAGALAKMLAGSPRFPGPVRWVRSPDDLPDLLNRLGVDQSSAIPIHALVDAQGNLRCVRVGAVPEAAYGTVRTLLAGG